MKLYFQISEIGCLRSAISYCIANDISFDFRKPAEFSRWHFYPSTCDQKVLDFLLAQGYKNDGLEFYVTTRY